jgi:DNA-directed RNA polymerase subunit RPC12/RpoP
VNIVDRDKWYFLIECENCDRAMVLSDAPSPQEIAEPTITALYRKCPHCGHKQTYQPEQVQRFQGIYL